MMSNVSAGSNTKDTDSALDALARDFQTVTDTYDGTGAPDPFPLIAELRRTSPVMEGDILARFNVPSQADYGGSEFIIDFVPAS